MLWNIIRRWLAVGRHVEEHGAGIAIAEHRSFRAITRSRRRVLRIVRCISPNQGREWAIRRPRRSIGGIGDKALLLNRSPSCIHNIPTATLHIEVVGGAVLPS